jgi:hypothetical protein
MKTRLPVILDQNRRTNSAILTRWQCPSCFEEHRCEVTECVQCGQPLACSVEEEDGRLFTVCELILRPHALDAL